MAADLKIYPLDYDSSTPGVGDGPSVLDVAVNSLKAEAELTSLRQASSRRKTMQAAIGIQNIAVQVINGSLLFDPDQLASDSQKTVAPVTDQLTGTIGLLTSSTSIDLLAIDYATSIQSIWGSWGAITTHNFASSSSGKDSYVASPKIRSINFALRTVTVQAYEFPIRDALSHSYGLGNKSKGYWLGLQYYSNAIGESAISIQYGSQVLLRMGISLPVGNFYGGLSSASTGYALNSFRQHAGEGGAIYALDYGTEVVTTLGSTTSPYGLRATSGNNTKGYVMGGKYFEPSVTEIQKFTFGTTTVSTLGAALSVARWFTVGFGSSTKGFAAGGSLRGGTEYTLLETLSYDTETVTSLGNTVQSTRLSTCTSDYYGGIQ